MESPVEKKCPNRTDNGSVCGYLLTSNVKFCPECGWKITKSFWQYCDGKQGI